MDSEAHEEARAIERELMDLFDRRAYADFLARAEAAPRSGLVAYYRFACLKNGLGAPKDEETAVEILSDGLPDLSEAAEKGDVCAQNAMGILSEKGVFPLLEQDPFEARQWYARAAEGGFAKAQANLARLCAAGAGGPVDLEAAVRLYRAAGDQGDAAACYRAASLCAQGLGAERNAETVAAYVKKAARNGHAQARALVEGVDGDFSPSRLMAELLIQLAEEACRRRAREEEAYEDEVRYRIEIRAEFPQGDEAEEDETGGDEWLLAAQPDGAEVPPAPGRARSKTPDLRRANPSFAAKLIAYVRDRCAGDAPRVYHAARINRKTYSAIVSNELRPVAKRTAVAFAFALGLSRAEADELLKSAGFALSPSILEDMVFAACLDAGIHDLDRVNRILDAHGAKPFLLQKG